VRAGGFLEPVNCSDVGMIQRCERLRLAFEPHQTIGVSRERVRQDLDRDLPAKRCVRRPIHLSHTAFTDLGGNFVDAEPCAWREGQSQLDYTGRTGMLTGFVPENAVV
jgi:hypothetical protein